MDNRSIKKLRSNAINSTNIDVWLNNIDHATSRLETYYRRLVELVNDAH